MAENKKVYVVGHKNPDTDSICTAIAYANLKKRSPEKRMSLVVQGSLTKRHNMYWNTLA